MIEIWCILREKVCWLAFVFISSLMCWALGAGTERVKMTMVLQKLHKAKSETNKDLLKNREYLTAINDVMQGI